MTTTSQIREWWSPACKANAADLTPAYKALDAVLKKHGYRPRSGVTGAFNCRTITGGTGYSLHAYDPNGIFTFWTDVRVTMALAVDINWDKNPYGRTLVTDMPPAMIAEIKAIRTNSGKQLWRWGGDYSGNKDAMHFEIIVSPADLATGIKTTEAAQPQEEDEDMADQLIWFKVGNNGPHCYRVVGLHGKWMPTFDAINLCKFLGVKEAVGAGQALGKDWVDSTILVDGPLQNVNLSSGSGSAGATKAQVKEAIVEELGFLKPGV